MKSLKISDIPQSFVREEMNELEISQLRHIRIYYNLRFFLKLYPDVSILLLLLYFLYYPYATAFH